jgi:hypothetical protein
MTGEGYLPFGGDIDHTSQGSVSINGSGRRGMWKWDGCSYWDLQLSWPHYRPRGNRPPASFLLAIS